MNILAINGSPRGRRSNTHRMIKEILKGAKMKRATTDNVFLSELKIKHCLGCFACWSSKKNRECIIKDDMQLIIEKYLQADIIIYGTPLYSDNISSLLKTFIDRCLPMLSPHLEKDMGGEYRHNEGDTPKAKFIIVSNGAFPEPSQFQVISHYFKRLARNVNTEVIAEIYRGQGLWLSLPKYSDNRPIIDAYFQLLNHVGEVIAINGTLSEEVQLSLQKEFASDDEYMRDREIYWKSMLSD